MFRIIISTAASPRLPVHLMGINLLTSQVRTTSRGCHRESSGGLSTFGPGICSFGKGTHVQLSPICRIVLPDNSVMINCMSATPTPNSPSVGIYLKVLGPGITVWLEGQRPFSACLTRLLTATQASVSALGISRLARCLII